MATFEDLYKERLTRELNNSDTNTLYTSTRRRQAVNDAQETFADLTECLIRQSSITVSCNVSEYLLISSGVLSGSTDFVRFAAQGVEYLVTDSAGAVTQYSGDDFPRRDIEWMNRFDPGWRSSTTPSVPPSWYLRPDGGNLYIGLARPPLVGSSQHAELVVPYVARPAAMTSTSDVPFSVNGTVRYDLTNYHRALPHYAAYRLLPLIGDQQGAQSQLQQFMGYVTRFLQALRPKGGTHVVMQRRYLQESRRSHGGDYFYSPTVPPTQWNS